MAILMKAMIFRRQGLPGKKAEVVSIWIGEILYEALSYKNAEAVKSLTETIKTEIEELVKDEL